eukprot:5414946-Pyramimonas_sp.AAC.1
MGILATWLRMISLSHSSSVSHELSLDIPGSSHSLSLAEHRFHSASCRGVMESVMISGLTPRE